MTRVLQEPGRKEMYSFDNHLLLSPTVSWVIASILLLFLD